MESVSRAAASPGVKATPWGELDPIDLKIIDALHDDGRASIAGLAKLTHLGVGKVKQRYERLVERGLLRTVALIDPGALGRPVVAHLDITTRMRNRALAERLASVPEVAWIGVGADYDNLLVQVSTSSNAQLVQLINEQVRADPNVERVVPAIVLRSWSPLFDFAGTAGDKSDPDQILWRTGTDSARELDDVDRAVLECLERDARMTLTAMSARAGLSVPATRQRLMKLMQEGTVKLRTRPDPQAEDISVVRIVMETRDDTNKVVRRLAEMPNVNFISESTGPQTLTMELLCVSETQISEGYERACQVPGVVAARLVRFGQILVHTGHW